MLLSAGRVCEMLANNRHTPYVFRRFTPVADSGHGTTSSHKIHGNGIFLWAHFEIVSFNYTIGDICGYIVEDLLSYSIYWFLIFCDYLHQPPHPLLFRLHCMTYLTLGIHALTGPCSNNPLHSLSSSFNFSPWPSSHHC